MIFSILATGSSAQHFVPRGHVIGVNDAARWGHDIHSLVVCNRQQQFSKERYEIIKNTKCEQFYSHKQGWSKEFPNWTRINLVTWYGHYRRNQVYSANSSPIIAITLAAKLGATDIIMWGCDFIDHHIFHSGNPETDKEIKTYLDLRAELKAAGINLGLGSKGTAFDNYFPVWQD